ncbi:MAG: histidine kinase [Bacteroidetes bacterium]|nr:histidine kinase [Bacteroidota bacterium]
MLYFSKKILLPALVLLLISKQITAQHNNIVFERIGKEQGLIPGNVNDVYQDSVGFIWMATENGLCKFDGYNFTYYRNHLNDETSLSYNHVFNLMGDHNGIIWVGTLGGGLNKFDSKTGKFKRFVFDPSNPKSLSNNNVFKIYKDSEDRIWVSTLGGGLNLFDPATETFTHYKHNASDPNSISSNMVSCLYEDKDKNFWIGTFDAGINLYKESEHIFIHFQNNPHNKGSLSHNQVMEFLEDSKGNFWVATFGGGVNLFDRASRKFRSIKNDPHFPMRPDNLNVRKMFEDEDSYWVGTYNGLFRFDKKTFAKTDLYSNPDDPTTINDNKVRAIYKDRTGVIWIGTVAGVNKYDSMRKNIQLIYFNENFKTFLGNTYRVPSKFITDKIIWAGPTISSILKSNSRNIRFFGNVDQEENFHTEQTSCLYIDENNVLWEGSYNGFYYYDNTKGQFHNVQYVDDGSATLGNNYVKWFYLDKQNRFWTGTLAGGLTVYDRQNNLLHRFSHNEEDTKTIGDSRVSCVFQDSKGVIWVGTYGGLDIYNEKNQTFKHYRLSPNDLTSISNDRIYCIYETRNGYLWIGTYLGLNKYNRDKDNFERFSSSQGLSDNTIYSMQEDDDGNLWLRTNDGVTKFDQQKKVFTNYNASDGIPSAGLNGNISFKSDDGKIFFGFSNGLIAFYPSEIKDNPYKPQIALTKLTIMDKEVKVGEDSPLTKPLNDMDEITLSHSDKVIGIEFSALHYAVPSKNQYAYKLEGVLDNWTYVDANNRKAKFTNLEPGTYILKVKASNNDGIWSDVERSIKLIVTPPFWGTWWFRGAAFVTVLFLIFLFYENRLQRLLSIERTRSRIARNLHDEVGGTLSSIQYFVRAIEKKLGDNHAEETTKYLNLIISSSSDAQEKIKDLIWTVNPEEDGLQKFLVKFNRYASDLLDSKHIEYHIDLPSGNLPEKIEMEKRQHLWCICKEIITNVAKHSQCKNVNIKFSLNGKILTFVVEDDGIGFVEKEKSSSTGLSSIRERAEAIKAKYSLTTNINEGTKWYFSVDL